MVVAVIIEKALGKLADFLVLFKIDHLKWFLAVVTLDFQVAVDFFERPCDELYLGVLGASIWTLTFLFHPILDACGAEDGAA